MDRRNRAGVVVLHRICKILIIRLLRSKSGWSQRRQMAEWLFPLSCSLNIPRRVPQKAWQCSLFPLSRLRLLLAFITLWGCLVHAVFKLIKWLISSAKLNVHYKYLRTPLRPQQNLPSTKYSQKSNHTGIWKITSYHGPNSLPANRPNIHNSAKT